jgi:hypothetical protein
MNREERREWRQKRLEERRADRTIGSRPQASRPLTTSNRVPAQQQRKGCGCSRSKG